MQPILLEAVLLVSSLAVLAFTANQAVNAISKFSKIVGISELSSGLVIVAVSTSMPEATVAVFSATSGNMGITLGDVFGSNVANVALVAAILLIVSPVKRISDRGTVVSLSRQLILASLIPFLLLVVRTDSREIGIGLLAIFAYFVYRTLKTGRVGKPERASGSPARQFLIFCVMISLVVVSARIIVESASSIAISTGVSESVIGASIVAIGTSLPELSVDIVAARKGHLGLALGDIIGSCVTNITLVLGIALSLSAVRTNFTILSELISFAIVAPLVMVVLIRGGRISVWRGLVLLAIYAAFVSLLYGTQFAISFGA